VHSLLAGLEEPAAGLGQGRVLLHVVHEFEDFLALEVAVLGNAVGSHEIVCVVSQDFSYLVRCPDKELALFASLSAS